MIYFAFNYVCEYVFVSASCPITCALRARSVMSPGTGSLDSWRPLWVTWSKWGRGMAALQEQQVLLTIPAPSLQPIHPSFQLSSLA